ncbi:RimJ/RimL family protein N-acetyltransferase [Rhizomicrobium palustre]|uniref:RimJ/RimL family protein N-acetyltransferase n=1 Tax=Rhizomicrobium palustre TaxID=189966 RepID=A0A846MWP6_9PROT|nr:GNAT family protein [Rhizomicrobium palustre]NIK87492.1 RimJ/RimL family protein N-acetyltransferase [Rhizomicrobium palustre]
MTLLEPGSAPQPVVLEGDRVRLHPLLPERDGPKLFAELSESDRLYRYLPTEAPGDAAAFAAHMAEWQSHPGTLQFVVEEKDTGRAAGTISYMRIAPEHRCLEVGYVLIAPWAQRSALVTEAHYLLARHVFEALGYRRYEWKCHNANAASRAAALRLGFSFEGVFRNHMIVKGENRDTAWFSIIDSEWPGVRRALEAWLAPENFDAEGRQRQPLVAFRER